MCFKFAIIKTTMWKSKYDASINQVYYENTLDGSVSFDLPCEVQNGKDSKRKPCQTIKPTLFSRLSRKLSHRRSASPPAEEVAAFANSEPAPKLNDESVDTSDAHIASAYLSGVAHMPFSLEDSYMFEEAFNLYSSDASSISSSESIQSFYLELLPNDIYYDQEQSIYYDNKAIQYIDEDYDKEKERTELRLQILKELY